MPLAACRPRRAKVTNAVKAWSLRHRLILIALFTVLSSVTLGGAAMYWAASNEDEQILDARLEQFGATVLSYAEAELSKGANEAEAQLPPLKTRPSAGVRFEYQIWSRQGRLLMRSHEAPSDSPLAPLARLGFTDQVIHGENHRVFALSSADRALLVQVAENVHEQWREILGLTAYYVAYLLIPFSAVCAIAWLMLRRVLSAVGAMADALGQRNPLDLTPLRVADPPLELLPMTQSMNALFARMGRALSTERQFTALAAHELRTPLSGLRAHAQLASMAGNEQELQDALQSMRIGIDRVSHLIDQLLDLAHIESLSIDGAHPFASVRLSDVYEFVMSDRGLTAASQQHHMQAQFLADSVQGHFTGLAVLMRNLLANALAYTPTGGRVHIGCELVADVTQLTVDDSGPGIPAAQRERAFERFIRLGQHRAPGVGLGLGIVLSVVELHGARIQLADSPLGGLRVIVQFGPPPNAHR